MDGGLAAGGGKGGEGALIGLAGDSHAVEQMADAAGRGVFGEVKAVEFEFGFQGGWLIGG